MNHIEAPSPHGGGHSVYIIELKGRVVDSHGGIEQ